MAPELPVLLCVPLLAFFIALPAAAAWRRRRRSRAASEAASALGEFASSVRRQSRCLPLEESLRARLIRLRVGEIASLQLALELARSDAALLADTAQRVALRLRRRVAFERKMLARTAPGLRRGAVAAIVPPAAVMMLFAMGLEIPRAALATLLLAELAGCLLLWHLARVEI
jgi:hypothetical protein